MKLLLTLLALWFSLGTSAQKRDFQSTSDLATYINSTSRDSLEKVYQAYRWVTANIHYDGENALAINHGEDRRALIDVAFAKRRGVCENFAAIFTDVCRLMGFQSVTIDGVTKQNSHVDEQGHTWSAVKISGDWFLFDPTWDAGSGNNFHYFRQTGSSFIATHLPSDPLWQMLNHPVNFKEFEAGTTSNRRTVFNYKDSIALYLSQDSLEQFAGRVARIDKAGISNKAMNLFYKVARSDLEGERQEQQMQWYNHAIKLLNECVAQLNGFITYRNSQFLPGKPDEEISSMLNDIDKKIVEATSFFDKVDSSKAVLVYGTSAGREQAEKLKTSFNNQKAFLDKYLSTAVTDRKKVFYH